MHAILYTRITLVWLLLLGATVASWELGHGIGGLEPHHLGIAILVVAFIKVRFVMLDFMEIRTAPLFARLLVEVWCVAICSILIALYLKAS